MKNRSCKYGMVYLVVLWSFGVLILNAANAAEPRPAQWDSVAFEKEFEDPVGIVKVKFEFIHTDSGSTMKLNRLCIDTTAWSFDIPSDRFESVDVPHFEFVFLDAQIGGATDDYKTAVMVGFYYGIRRSDDMHQLWFRVEDGKLSAVYDMR